MPAMMLHGVITRKKLMRTSLCYFESFHGQNKGDHVDYAIFRAMDRAGNLFVSSQLLSVFSLAIHNTLHQLEYYDFTH